MLSGPIDSSSITTDCALQGIACPINTLIYKLHCGVSGGEGAAERTKKADGIRGGVGYALCAVG
jgi:hypothetical protein